MPEKLQGLGGFQGFAGQKPKQNQNPNAAFNRAPGMMPNQAPPQMPPQVQNGLPVNPMMNRPQMRSPQQMPSMNQMPFQRQSQLPPQVMQNPPATNMQDILMRLRNRGY